MKTKNKRKILIIGIAGGLAQILARILLQENQDIEVIGVDARNTDHCAKIDNLYTSTMKYSRGNFETLFRDHEFDCVYHLARISQSSHSTEDIAKRLELNVMGTSRILDLCLKFKVPKVILLSTFHVYGALPDNSVFLTEESPLKASIKYPELRDVVELDQICTNWMWKYQNEIETIVLRPCNIIGNQIQNAMSRFLTAPVVLAPIDYNPHFQFIHEFDMARVLVECLSEVKTGIYNVAPNEFISMKDALKILGGKQIPFPMSIGHAINSFLAKIGLDVPDYFIDYLKFSCLIDGKNLNTQLGEDFYRFKIEETLKLMKLK